MNSLAECPRVWGIGDGRKLPPRWSLSRPPTCGTHKPGFPFLIDKNGCCLINLPKGHSIGLNLPGRPREGNGLATPILCKQSYSNSSSQPRGSMVKSRARKKSHPQTRYYRRLGGEREVDGNRSQQGTCFLLNALLSAGGDTAPSSAVQCPRVRQQQVFQSNLGGSDRFMDDAVMSSLRQGVHVNQSSKSADVI